MTIKSNMAAYNLAESNVNKLSPEKLSSKESHHV